MGDDHDPFEELVLDEDFVKKGVPEPPPPAAPVHPRWETGPTGWRQGGHPGPARAAGAGPRVRRRRRPVPTAFGVSWIFVLLLSAFVGTAYASWDFGGSRPAVFGFVISGWLLSLTFHEFSHAAVAYLGGDRSVVDKGYLTLDVRRYAHPVLSYLLPVLFVILGGIGLPGGAVWIDRAQLRSRSWRSAVSLAGPFANAVCALACLLPFVLVASARGGTGPHLYFWSGLAFLGYLQLFAVLLNLLPIPGLDGWGALEPHLPSHVVYRARRISPFVFLIVFFVVFSSPTIGGRLSELLNYVEVRFRVPSGMFSYGYYLMKFWEK